MFLGTLTGQKCHFGGSALSGKKTLCQQVQCLGITISVLCTCPLFSDSPALWVTASRNYYFSGFYGVVHKVLGNILYARIWVMEFIQVNICCSVEGWIFEALNCPRM